MEFTKLAKFLETKGGKILHNVKTQWISMLALAKRLLQEYKTLVVKMANDSLGNVIAKNNYELLCDYDTILGLIYVLPMMEAIQSLSKMAQGRDTFVCDLVSFIILCTSDLYSWYVNPLKRYDHPQF